VRSYPELPQPEWLSTLRWFVLIALLAIHGHLAAASSSLSQRQADTVISPQGDGGPGVRDSGMSFPLYTLIATAGLAAGAWLWVRSSRGASRLNAKKASIVIEEVRSLGNRQHLILASCRGRSFLLGVSPGRIETISGLPTPESDR
jgi:Flagellar biosynthesis protein, FliO